MPGPRIRSFVEVSSSRACNHANLHVRGYKEEGTATTPFDMAVMNQHDRFNLAMDVIDRVPRLHATSGSAREELKNRLVKHKIYVQSHGEDMEEIRNWRWTSAPGPEVRTDDPALNAPKG